MNYKLIGEFLLYSSILLLLYSFYVLFIQDIFKLPDSYILIESSTLIKCVNSVAIIVTFSGLIIHIYL